MLDLRDNTIEIIQGEGDSEKKWISEWDICSNPTCSCSDMEFKLFEAETANGDTFPKHRFCLDVFGRKAVKLKGEKATSKEDFRFAKSFAKDLSESDWNDLRQFYVGYKRYITESTPIAEFTASFPEREIEIDGSMIGYFEILPYAEEISVCVDDTTYVIDDQYCLSSKCSCRDVALSFIPIGAGKTLRNSGYLTIFLDYKKKSWRIEAEGSERRIAPDALVKEMFDKRLEKKLEKRHRNLRAIYKNYRKKKQRALRGSPQNLQSSEGPAASEKIGRNQPCPCGSGKKFKKCCMLKK